MEPSDFTKEFPLPKGICTPPPPPKRQRKKKSDPSAALVSAADGTVSIAKPKRQYKPRAPKNLLSRSEEHTLESRRQKLHVVRNDSSSHHLAHTNEVEEHFNENGKLAKRTHRVKTEEKREESKRVELTWEDERQKRVSKINELKVMPEEKAVESRSFRYYIDFLHKEVECLRDMIMKTNSTFDDPNDKRHFIHNRDIVSRFLFAVPSTFKPQDVPWPSKTHPTWLACLWTMREMLEWCEDLDFCERYRYNPFHTRDRRLLDQKLSLDPSAAQKPLFVVNNSMMAGYVTGHMLLHVGQVQQLLAPFLRESVRQESKQVYFPVLDSFCGNERTPMQMVFRYDFRGVAMALKKQLPRDCAENCTPKNTCTAIGDGVEAEGCFLALLKDGQVKSRCFRELESTALEKPYDSESYGSHMDELQMMLNSRLQFDQGPVHVEEVPSFK